MWNRESAAKGKKADTCTHRVDKEGAYYYAAANIRKHIPLFDVSPQGRVADHVGMKCTPARGCIDEMER